MYILAIETSCDDTGVAIMHYDRVCANVVASQMVHQNYGGVVPELASRAHLQNIIPVCQEALSKAGITLQQISAVAVTKGPGLQGALLTGMSFAKSLALALDVPLLAINHMEAHILAHFIDEPRPSFPFLCLTVSGGHTQIVRVDDYFNMYVLGETLDDAVGEAFDKCAKILGLGYPGGVLIDRLAKDGNPLAFNFPIAKTEGLNFSFSGVKTAFLYFVQQHGQEFIQQHLTDVCASIQHTLIETLLLKLKQAVEQTGISQVAIAGGVSANSYLRSRIEQMQTAYDWQVYIPQLQYCTDNAAMIGIAGWLQFQSGKLATITEPVAARLPISSS